MKDMWFEARAGWLTPQFDFQITPLEWGVAICWDNKRIGIRVGPIAMMVWLRWTKFEKKIDCYWSRDV